MMQGNGDDRHVACPLRVEEGDEGSDAGGMRDEGWDRTVGKCRDMCFCNKIDRGWNVNCA